MKITAIIVAAGRGTRAGGKSPKQWQYLGGKRIIDHSIDLFKNIPRINKIMVVLHSDDLHLLDRNDVLFTQGGSTRSESVKSGLTALQQSERPDYVLIHDAARPSTPLALINTVIDNLETVNAVSPALPVTDTLWEVVREAEDMKFNDALNMITKSQFRTVETLYRSEDQLEGARAFSEKRDPVWKGK